MAATPVLTHTMSPLPPTPSPSLTRGLAELPSPPASVRSWRILLLVSAVNSLTQRVLTHLADLGFDHVSTELALSDDDMYGAVIAHSPQVVLCPFLVKKVPEQIYQNVITLIVHPGPPGDAGPAALDWAILGDIGDEADAALALTALQAPLDRALPLRERQRTHWGITVLQADHTMDGGPVWAFDQFPLPDIATVTKSSLYQNEVSSAVLRAVTVALCRLGACIADQASPLRRASVMGVRPDARWARECVSLGAPFMGGPLHERPQIKPGQRRPRLDAHTAADVARIANCGDSQPGATLATAKSFVFVYDAHVHARAADLPPHVALDGKPAGAAIATRAGAVLFKTAPCAHAACSYGCGVAVWLTHGRVPKAANSGALNPKVPLAEALVAAGEGARLDGVPEWDEADFAEKPGTWQQVFVRSVVEGDAMVQLVYWDFYNGAFSTDGCRHLLRALQWAADPARGHVKVLALMGGAYFSNGVALNIIEAAAHPGQDTWANINAIDDVVEFLAGDVARERSPLFASRYALPERGIVTVACVRGNAAAGGVALAAACDVVLASNAAVLNPAYRAMGLHGSELHLYSYVARCGRDVATHLVRDMLPLSASQAADLGLVDAVVGGRDVARDEAERLLVERVRQLASAPAEATAWYGCAPWVRPLDAQSSTPAASLVAAMCANKRERYASPAHTPLVHYRHEELSQMLLDNFHPVRSARYHTRRIKFVRKVKATKTPNRFVHHRVPRDLDDEDGAAFDDAPGWVRGDEWGWVGEAAPASLATSARLRIDFAAQVAARPARRGSAQSSLSASTDASSSLHTVHGSGSGDDDVSFVAGSGLSAANGLPLSPPPSSGFLAGRLRPKQHESVSILAPPHSLAKPILKVRPASFMAAAPRSITIEPSQAPTPTSASSAATVPMPTSLPPAEPVVLTAALPDKPRMAKRLSRDVFSTVAGPRAATAPPQLEHVAAGKKVGRFATLGRLLKSKRDSVLVAPPPPPRLATQPPATPAVAVSRDDRADGVAAAAARLQLNSTADKYLRPVVDNEGDTESPCLYNTVGQVPDFPAVPERNGPVVISA